MNSFDEMQSAVNEAKQKIRIADNLVGQMANMIEGRLRSGSCSSSTLKALKRELRDFNIHTGCWNKKS